MRDPRFQQMQEQGIDGVVVELETCEAFVYAHPFGGDGPRVAVLWGDEPMSCISVRATHAQALADALRRILQPSGVPLEVVAEGITGQTATVQMRRQQGGDSVALAAAADGWRISTPQGVALNIPIGAASQLADALTESLRRLNSDG